MGKNNKLRRSPRVTQILYSGLGGHANVAFSMLGGDKEKVWKPAMLFVGVEPLLAAFARHCEMLNMPYEAIRTVSKRPWLSWRKIYVTLKRQCPDAVILHSVSSLLPVALYCITRRVRLVTVEHTPIDLKTKPECWLSALALLLSDAVVTLTESYRFQHIAKNSWFQSERKLVVIPNGIDVTRYIKTHPRSDERVVRIGMAARFSSSKRQDLLVEALTILRLRHPEVDWRLTLAGDGEFREKVQELASAKGVGGYVELPGNLGEDELIAWFRSLDLYAHASEGEAMSTSMLQAMSMSLPIAASPVAGINELLKQSDGVCGLLVDDNEGASFSDGLLKLALDPFRSNAMAAAARARVVAHHSQELMFESYDRLIEG